MKRHLFPLLLLAGVAFLPPLTLAATRATTTFGAVADGLYLITVSAAGQGFEAEAGVGHSVAERAREGVFEAVEAVAT